MKPKILVLVPCKPNIHPKIKEDQLWQLEKMEGANPELELEVIVDMRGSGDRHIRNLDERVIHNAGIRQGMIDEYLTDHDYVLWIDSDIVLYPIDIPTSLLEYGKGNVCAPLVLLDGYHKRFYDLAGFLHKDQTGKLKWADMNPPYFPGNEMESVGAFVMFPAKVFKEGKFSPTSGFTEWLSVCQHAKRLGYKVLACRELTVWHINLADYGESWH